MLTSGTLSCIAIRLWYVRSNRALHRLAHRLQPAPAAEAAAVSPARRRASTGSTSPPGSDSSSGAVRRKPIPAYLDPPAQVSRITLSGPPTLPPKDLVRLLDGIPEGPIVERPDAGPGLFVTPTTKARFDGAMHEIAAALRAEP